MYTCAFRVWVWMVPTQYSISIISTSIKLRVWKHELQFFRFGMPFCILSMGRESSDDEEEKHISRPLKKRKANIDREASIRHEFLMKDYFIENCVYTDEQFARRYRMPKSLGLNVMEIVKKNNRYFQQRPDCTGKLGLSTEQKMVGKVLALQLIQCQLYRAHIESR
jgi:hypothetical protein